MDLLELHMLDGNTVHINPVMIVSLREPQQSKDKQVTHQDVQCIVNFVDGKFVTVIESCAIVRARLASFKKS